MANNQHIDYEWVEIKEKPVKEKKIKEVRTLELNQKKSN
jgi:hypothetical protein